MSLRELFGSSKKEIWKSLSEQTNSEFNEGGFFKGSDKVVVKHKNWTITLDTYTVSTGKSSTTYTRIRAPYVNADGFRFSIYRSGILPRFAVVVVLVTLPFWLQTAKTWQLFGCRCNSDIAVFLLQDNLAVSARGKKRLCNEKQEDMKKAACS